MTAAAHHYRPWQVWLLVILPAALVLMAGALVLNWYLTAEQMAPPQVLPNPSHAIEQLPGISYDTAGLARAAMQPPRVPSAGWQPLALPHAVPLPSKAELHNPTMSRLWVRATVATGPLTPDDTMAIYMVRAMGGAIAVRVNGELVMVNLDEWRTQWNQPLLVAIPRHLTHTGQPLDVQIGLPYLDAQGFSMGSIFVGKRTSLQPAYDMRVFFQRTLPQVGMIVTLIMGVLSFHFWLSRRSETDHLLLGAVCLAWLVCNTQYFFDFEDDPWASLIFGSLVDSAVSWVMVLLVIFVLRFQTRSFKRLELGLLSYAFVTAVVTLPWWGWQLNALVLQHSFDVAIGGFICGLLLWRAWVEKKRELWALWASCVAMLLLGAYDTFGLTSQANPDGIHLFPYAIVLLFMAMTYAMQKRHIQALQASDRSTATLASELAAQQEAYAQELVKVSQAEVSHVKQQERERLRMSIKDRLNHQIQSVLRQVQSGECSSEQLAHDLKACFNETRMVIESLEPVHHDIETLLGTMRPRFEAHLRQQGIGLQWRPGMVDPLPWLEAPQCLMVLRWVQEAAASLASTQVLTTLTLMTHQTDAHIVVVLRAMPFTEGDGDGVLPSAPMPVNASLQTLATLLGGSVTACHQVPSHQEIRLLLNRVLLTSTTPTKAHQN